MSNNTVPSIETLPTELLHRIFDDLDTETILLSLRPVCRLFRSVVNTYDRYVLDFNSISKRNFYLLCRLINPQNIISLVLCNNKQTSDQIALFIPLVRLRQLTRLRSLTLRDIDECQLSFILKRMNLKFLTSFSFSVRKYDNRRIETTTNLLSSIIAKSALRKLEFDIKTERMSKISWPINCTIQSLTINNGMTIDNFYTILQCSIHLRTLIIKQSFDSIVKDIIPAFPFHTSFRQLTFLTIEQLHISMDKLESFLILTPSLVYLKLIGGRQMLDGKRWEQFIGITLPNLGKFEFYFDEWSPIEKTPEVLELIITSFRTPFWIEYKKWIVNCEYSARDSETHLYSVPICESYLQYTPNSQKTFLAANTMVFNNDRTIMNNINSLILRLSKTIANDIQEKKAMASDPLFPKVTKIDMRFNEEQPLLSLQSISTLINISQIVEIKMYSCHFKEYNENTFMNIRIFIKEAHNLSSLIIECTRYQNQFDRTVENIHSIIPSHVRHLQIPINNVDKIKLILEHCQYLSTLQLDLRYSKSCEEVINWFANNTINSTCWKGYETVAVWLGKKGIQSTEIKVKHKRIKVN